MTAINFLILFFISFSCGNDITIKNNRLESQSTLSIKDLDQKTGVLTRGAPSRVMIEDKSYEVSVYSSKSCQDFIKNISDGASVEILFRGQIKGNEVIIETIQKKEGPTSGPSNN